MLRVLMIIVVLGVCAGIASARAPAETDQSLCENLPVASVNAAFAGQVEAQVLIGLALLDGVCGWAAPSVDEGIRWLERAAAQDHPLAAAKLAIVFDQGLLRPRDHTRALTFYEQAARHGHRPSQNRLGLLLVSASDSVAQKEQGLFWLGAAADQGDGRAAATIGLFYARGLHGIERNRCVALDWYHASELLQADVPVEALRSEIPASVARQC